MCGSERFFVQRSNGQRCLRYGSYVIVVTVIMIRIITTKYYLSLHGYCRKTQDSTVLVYPCSSYPRIVHRTYSYRIGPDHARRRVTHTAHRTNEKHDPNTSMPRGAARSARRSVLHTIRARIDKRHFRSVTVIYVLCSVTPVSCLVSRPV